MCLFVNVSEVDEKEIGAPEKCPEHTFEVAHSRRRSYLITAENEEEKHAWIETIKVCCRKAEGKHGARTNAVVFVLSITNDVHYDCI